MPDAARPAASGTELLAALRALERRFVAQAAGLPTGEPAPGIWAGILFQVGGRSMVAALREISEVLDLPHEITRIPGTKPWVEGLTNNRGTLLPIFDLQGFLVGHPTPRGPSNRVLVVRQEAFPFGLLVGSVVGIRHFDVSMRKPPSHLDDLEPSLVSLVVGSFRQGDLEIPIFSAARLTGDGRFALAVA